MKIEISFLLPLAAFVAIALFILREILESIRKRGERNRKISAAKSLLAFETERNYYTQKRIFEIVRDIRDHHGVEDEYEFNANVSSVGDVFYSRKVPGESHVSSGMPIPKVFMSEFDRWLPTVAEIDQKLFERTMSMYTTIFELEHLRSSLIRYLLIEDEEGQFWLEGFAEYALGHTEEMDTSFKEFYRECVNTAEIPIRMR